MKYSRTLPALLALSIAAIASKMQGAIFMAFSPESDRRAESPRLMTL